jgi:hypothetical protein
MSSIPNETVISSCDLQMMETVLSDAGFKRDVLSEKDLFNAAAMMVMKLFQGGMTKQSDLLAEVLFYFGEQKQSHDASVPMLPRYAIQGLPSHTLTIH